MFKNPAENQPDVVGDNAGVTVRPYITTETNLLSVSTWPK